MVDSNYTCLTVISLYSALKKDENYYPKMFLKESKHNERKKVIRNINDNLSDISSSSDVSDEEKIKAIWLMILKMFFEGAI